MPRKKSPHLTDSELRLMEVVWEKGAASVGEVAEIVSKESPLAYSSVLTTLRILETKGYLKHIKQGRQFVYRPVVDREQARDNALSHFLRRFFDDSPELLMNSLVEKRKIGSKELARLRKKIEEAKE